MNPFIEAAMQADWSSSGTSKSQKDVCRTDGKHKLRKKKKPYSQMKKVQSQSSNQNLGYRSSALNPSIGLLMA